MRCFIAIELPAEARAHLARVQERLRSCIASGRPRDSQASFTRGENLHITLKFLGEADDGLTAKLAAALVQVRGVGEIVIRAGQVECFPERGPVRIVAAGFAGALPALASLHEAIEERCQGLGFAREMRAYRPHVTLARARPTLPSRVRPDLTTAASADFPGPEIDMRDFVLMRSHLGQGAPRYEVIARFGLADRE